MRILFLHHYAGSPTHGMSYRVYYLAREWVKAGHYVHVHAASYSHIRTIQPELLDRTLTEVIDGINYTWHKTPHYSKNGIKRALNILSFSGQIYVKAKKIADECKPDVVIAASTHPLDIWAAQKIKKNTGAKLIFEVRDLWPLTLIELGKISKWHPFIILMQKAENYAYKKADNVITVLPCSKNHMQSKGMLPSKFHYIPNGIDPSEWEKYTPLPDEIYKSLEIVKSLEKPIIAYAGTYGLANALDTLLDAAKLSQRDFEVILVGNGPERDRLSSRIQDEQINNVTLMPNIKKNQIPAFLKFIDIAYIGLLPKPLFRFGISPNKLMDYMMSGKPIVCAIQAGNDPVKEAQCGLTVPPSDVYALRDAILKLITMPPSERVIMGNRGKTFILEKQTYPTLAQEFMDVMDQ